MPPSLPPLSALYLRIKESNNRSLGTLFGCLSGFVLGVVLACDDSILHSFPIVGSNLSLSYKVLGVILCAGTGGNLCSYIGASIDIVSGEKTVFDLLCLRSSITSSPPSHPSSNPPPTPHAHFPYITSTDALMSRHFELRSAGEKKEDAGKEGGVRSIYALSTDAPPPSSTNNQHVVHIHDES